MFEIKQARLLECVLFAAARYLDIILQMEAGYMRIVPEALQYLVRVRTCGRHWRDESSKWGVRLDDL